MDTITVKRDKLTSFLNALKLLIDCNCTDCDINKGIVRQRTNDSKCIIEIDLTDIIGETDIPLSDIRLKVNTLKTFELDPDAGVDSDSVTIQIGEKDYNFVDELSTIVFRRPLRQMLDNKFMTEDDLNSKVKRTEDNLIFEKTISSYTAKKRIKTLCDAFSTDVVSCIFDGHKGKIKIAQSNNENLCFIDEFDLERELRDKYFTMINVAFSLDVLSDVQFNVYDLGNDIVGCYTEQKIDNEIPIRIYSMSKILDNG